MSKLRILGPVESQWPVDVDRMMCNEGTPPSVGMACAAAARRT